MTRIMLLVLLLCPFCTNAQIILKGNVRNNSAPVGWASILLSNQQGTMITGEIAREDGSFELSVKKGTYKIKISFLGFKDWQKEMTLDTDTDLGIIILRENTDELKEVVVTGRKNLITYQPDRLIFDVESSVSATGGNAINAISAAPGIVIQNNAITMLGKGASQVMIDGRILELSGEELVSYLKSISASDIKSVEIITNPPAKYEAAGNGGLINIILKRGAANSWKNTSGLSFDQNTYRSYALRNNFLYNRNKFRFALSAGAKLGYTKVKQDLNIYYPQGPWEVRYAGKQKEDNFSGRIALDYDITPKTTLGIQYLGNAGYPGSNDLTKIFVRNTGNSLDSSLLNIGKRDLNSVSHTYNAHIVQVLDTLNRKISADFDYFTYEAKTDNNFVATAFSPAMEFLNINQSARNISDQHVSNFSAKADVEFPLKFVNLSYGAKVSLITSRAGILYYNTISGLNVLDKGRSNEFQYRETNHAFYMNADKSVNQKLSFQVGLRVENTRTKGYSFTLNQNNRNSYLKLFPTLYVSYVKNENHSFLLNYGKRINRPGFGILNPFRSYLNSNSYSEGNPFLQPSFSDNFDFTHVYKGMFRTNIFVNITNDGFGPVFTSDAQTNTLVISRQNYYKEHYYGIGESFSTNITAWWQSQHAAYWLGSKSRFTSQIDAKPQNGAQIYLSTNNTFSLGKSSKLQVDYLYASKTKRGLYETGYMSGLNIAFKQNLFKNNIQLSLLVNDVFNTAYLKNYTSVVNGIKQVYDENNSSRFFRLSLTYSFGNNKISVKQRDFGNDNERSRAE
ncbi:outer membrane beta-barrel family protein [Dyadobacter diqingensis]|uniref:outer membrane beta-barrel family protein n=1 Tax=Dyadobacter diqingensis TaxID=2938121 RepID=UPI0020C20D45|nr:outer membrane beta-barrel family protein [Dyadobacter diqingensis]